MPEGQIAAQVGRIENPAQRQLQRLRRGGLYKEIQRAGPDRLHGLINRAHRGQHDGGAVFAQFRQKAHSIAVGQAQIKNSKIGPEITKSFQRYGTGKRTKRLIPQTAKLFDQKPV
nr:hypothetical protein [Paracoccus sp. (in: a-proteobacteria)]